MFRLARPLPRLGALGLCLVALACSREPDSGDAGSPVPGAQGGSPGVLPDALVLEEPQGDPLNIELVEDYSEEVANALVDFADKLRRRDLAGAAAWLDPTFAGHALDGLAEAGRDALPLDTQRLRWEAATAPIVGRGAFLDSIAARIGPWKRVEAVVWKVKHADFQARPLWGRVTLKITFLGTGADGGPREVVAWAQARAKRSRGQWVLDRLLLESLEETSRARFLFTDVSTSAGVAHSGIRFGQPGNDSFAWNGAAAGDADGDGLDDLFVPSRPRNFLYLARDAGGFTEVGSARGLASPAGGTGAVFFDADGDGDQDLAVADVGWRGPDGSLGGNPTRFHRNDGTGSFAEVGAEVGLDALGYGYTVVVLDHDLDGHLDLYVCNYGRQQSEPNNSWLDATNGMSNRLYRNDGTGVFADVTADAGIEDRRWSYAASAADFDVDGDMDLYVANDYATNTLWANAGDGTFEDVAEELGVEDLGNGMGAAWGDLDSDGALDLYVANMSSTAGNRILRRLRGESEATAALVKMAAGNTIFLAGGGTGGDSAFARLGTEMGGIGASWAWSPALFDLDLDGRLDIFNANGFVTGDTAADT